jgi:hypothetical protein
VIDIRDYMGNKWEWSDRQWRSVGCQFIGDTLSTEVLYTTEDDDVYGNTILYFMIKEMKKKHIYIVPEDWVADVINKSMYQDDIAGYLKKRIYERARQAT